MAIKGLDPALGAIYTPPLQWSQVHTPSASPEQRNTGRGRILIR
ncbi:hypothetical protein A2U01_0093236 [Trifolium medium]|uniref:Uncharacterized protein n=1 Tax=Trifolium medium TaxID=97028 RepID=A0A392UEN2_9FABA|nr:hypothetical protein [Trifolium medium]